jgi:hypothetical protein
MVLLLASLKQFPLKGEGGKEAKDKSLLISLFLREKNKGHDTRASACRIYLSPPS